MDDLSKNDTKAAILENRLQNILKGLSHCKINYLNEKEECMKLREINSKLEVELKSTRELEKSHRYHLSSSREMIGNLQETVSQLVFLKRDNKRLKDELLLRDSSISAAEREKENAIAKHSENLMELKNAHSKHTEEIEAIHERKIQEVQHDADTQIAQFSCVIEELRAKIKEIEHDHKEKMNMTVLEYEEKLQRSAAQLEQLHDQHAGLAARSDANIDAYRRRFEELEEKLKQSEFKQYLSRSTLPFESQVERPYSANKDPYEDIDFSNVPKSKNSHQATQSQNQFKPNTLQVTYYGNKPKTDKKGPFNITKKRKLYNEKDFQDF